MRPISAAFEVAQAAPAKAVDAREPAIDVTLTTEPLAFSSSARSPRASMTGAKKFTWNTFCQSESVVSIVPSRAPAGALGRDAGVVDECVEPSVLEATTDLGDRLLGVGGIGEVDLDVVPDPSPTGSSRGRDGGST